MGMQLPYADAYSDPYQGEDPTQALDQMNASVGIPYDDVSRNMLYGKGILNRNPAAMQNAGFYRLLAGQNRLLPNLDLGNSTNVTEGALKGIGNFMALRNYARQQRAYQGIAQSIQAHQQQLEQAQQQALQAKQDQLKQQYALDIQYTHSPQAAQAFLYDPKARTAFYANVAGAQGQLAKGDILREGQQQRNLGAGYNLNAQGNAVPLDIPTIANRALYGLPGNIAEKTLQERQQLEATQQALNKNAPSVAAAPQLVQQELQKGQLGLQGQGLENQMKGIDIQYAPDLKSLEVATGKLSNEEFAQKQKSLQEAQTLFSQYGQQPLTPEQRDYLNAQLKGRGSQLQLPEGPTYKDITNKGQVTGVFNPQTGEVFKPGQVPQPTGYQAPLNLDIQTNPNALPAGFGASPANSQVPAWFLDIARQQGQ